MTSASDRPDDGLGERLRELDAAGVPETGPLFDEMFSELKARCDERWWELSASCFIKLPWRQ